MQTTIDTAGRLVIPKALRERVGIVPGEVEIEVDGAELRIRSIAGDVLEHRDGFLVTPSDLAVTVDDVRTLRDADQR